MLRLKNWTLLLFLIVSHFLGAVEIDVAHTQGSGIGYDRQYSKIGVYHAFESHSFQPFIDLRYLLLNKWKQGANFGAGLGYQFPQQNRVSAYAYFDLTESRTSHIFNQMTGGLSYTHPLVLSGKDWGEFTCYLNGYFPMKSVEKRVSKPSFKGFEGNHLLIGQTDRYALTGGNLEVGFLTTCWKSWSAYVAGSAYYFKRAELHAFGGYGKVRLTYNDLISIQGQVSGDRLFGTNVNGTIGIRIPLGKKDRDAVKNRLCRTHRSRPIERLEPMVLDKVKRKTVAKDSSGNPLNFFFVNNLSSSQGTYEDPFSTLADAQNASKPGDFIYVFPGDGTTTGMDAGFTMQERQTLSGAGTALAVSTSQGRVIVPAMSAAQPTITNLAGNGVDIARNCTVNGISVMGTSGDGFNYSNGAGSSTINLQHCSARSTSGEGFSFDSQGTSQNTVVLSNCRSTDATRNGFRTISNDSSQLTQSCFQCVGNMSGIDNFGISSNDSSQMNLSFDQCLTMAGGDGFFLSPDNSSTMTANFVNCSASNASDDNFNLRTNDSAQATLNLNNFTSGPSGGNGIELITNGTSALAVTLNQCNASSAGVDNFGVSSNGSSTMNLSFNECHTNGGGDGFFINCGSSSVMNLALNQCSATSALDDGFDAQVSGSGQMNVSMNHCTATTCKTGFECDGTGGNLQTLNMFNCSAINNSLEGFKIGQTGSNIQGSLTNCTGIVGPGLASFNVSAINVGSFDIFTDTTIDTKL